MAPDIAMYGAAMQALGDAAARGECDAARVWRVHDDMTAQGIVDNEVTRRILDRLPRR